MLLKKSAPDYFVFACESLSVPACASDFMDPAAC